MLAKALHVDAVEGGEIARIVEPDIDLGHIGQGAAAQRQRFFQALEDLARLHFNAALHDHTLVVGGHGARDKNEVTSAHGGREWARQTIGRDGGLA